MNKKNNNAVKNNLIPPDDALWFLPLGGAGEIGMNASLYGTAGQWLMLDCGVMFGDEATPGIDLIMPDISFITSQRDRLQGLVITHGHEDHIGAIGHLWPQLQCPIYATKFTAELIRSKLEQADLKNQVRIIEIPLRGKASIGNFEIELVHVTHSVPESNMVVVKTKAGNVLHTGDWKFDPAPVVGDVSDEKRLRELGAEGIMAVVGDSTNAMVAGRSGSELDVQKGLGDIMAEFKQRIVVTCFASNIARVKSVIMAAKRNGRSVTFVGRSLWRNGEIAEICGYLPEFNNILTEAEAMQAPRDKIVMICTGCQGEVRSALARMSIDDHPEAWLEAGDAAIFSSRDIPGNEKVISQLQNRLLAAGVRVITQDHTGHSIHASGHPAAGELVDLYTWIKPAIVVPVHGELRHQQEHARIAKHTANAHTIICRNGQVINLNPKSSGLVGEVAHGKLGLDGKVLRHLADNEVSKERKKMSYQGVGIITMVMNAQGKVMQEPQVSFLGLGDEVHDDREFREDLLAIIYEAVERMPKSTRIDNAAVKHSVMRAVKGWMMEVYGKKPVMEAHIVRVEG